VQNLTRLGFQRVAAQVFVFLLDFAKAFEDLVELVGLLGIFHGALQVFQFVMEIANPSTAGDGFIND